MGKRCSCWRTSFSLWSRADRVSRLSASLISDMPGGQSGSGMAALILASSSSWSFFRLCR
eukprot:CAMPEP_0113950610 /NCGR_PEP_ID=MMETSP1339-20121228/81695_1 /TAXON_ID=94617 /ORGANISM="Fibrocapsa japonica" /LENGTH=59 /DNA_ID=CAMNT_0000958503 /DNA_START=39 /DNA_END=218 /DNA_ORIENTATION=- /assembly_acc=CAM_ASM_000762